MSIHDKLKPKFWDYHDVAAGPYRPLFNFRRIWGMAVLLTCGVVLIPLIFITIVDYHVTQHDVESEILLRTARLVSNTRRAVSYFLAERKAALDFIDKDNTLEALKDASRLANILENLKKAFGGFVDIGVIDSSGNQKNYVGPYDLAGENYSDQEWFKHALDRGVYISDVFLGHRKIPHLIIAVKHNRPDGSFYLLRATLDTERFKDILSNLELSEQGDAFVINHQGRLQTPSLYYGKVFEKILLPIPEYAPETRVVEWKNVNGVPLIIGYRYIEDTPFILMVVKQKDALMTPWYNTRTKLIGFLVVSVITILIVILGGATYLVTQIYKADQRRIITLHQVEYSNKLASIGRLAAGVAHEINNPLAIINEKAGLIKDLFTIKDEFARDQKLIGLVNSVLTSVERCATITRRLLTFARHMESTSTHPVNLKELIHDVLGFLAKEAEYKSISISVNVADDVPQFESNRGRLQQIFLNIINNAFAALDDGGHLDISAKREDKDLVSIIFTDDGCGIAKDELNRIFEPFFSTKTGQGGTGLGLSITYGLVQELGGKISVTSELGKGTRFTIVLPLKMEKDQKWV